MRHASILMSLLPIVAVAAACTTSSVCETTAFPAASGTVLYVSQECGAKDGDGSKARPFLELAGATAAAKPGTTVLVAAGTYAESVTLPAGVSMKGVARNQVTIGPPAQAAGKAAVGIEIVEQPGEVTVTAVTISGATSLGVHITKANVKLSDVAVKATSATITASGSFLPDGHGIWATEAQRLTLESCAITGNAGTGVGTKGVDAVVVTDPNYKQVPRRGPGGNTSIIDPHFAPASVIADNKGGGIAIIDPHFMPGGSQGGGHALMLIATNVSGNTGFGVAVYGAGVAVVCSAIHGTKAAIGSDYADGLLVAPAVAAAAATLHPDVSVDKDSTVANNGRAGVLVAAGSEVALAGEFSANGMGGIWAQGKETTVRVAATSRLSGNSMLGVAATGGARLLVDGATIEDTKAALFAPSGGGKPTEVGDGVTVFGRSRAQITNAIISNNFRAGVLVNDLGVKAIGGKAEFTGSEVTITKSHFEGGSYGIAINQPADAGAAPTNLETANTFSPDKPPTAKVDTKAKLPGQAAVCLAGTDSKGMPKSVSCDDGNDCTIDTCDPVKGCQYTGAPEGAACDDHNGCTSGDKCSFTQCVGIGETCNDNNPCTDDTCDAPSTCHHANNHKQCIDNNICNSFDTCDNGACAGSPKNCDDGDDKTLDSCIAPNGCKHTPK